jgi:hypothetical protein
MTVKLLVKPFKDWNVTPSIKSLLREGHYKADNDGMRKEMRPQYQMFGDSFSFTLHLFGKFE